MASGKLAATLPDLIEAEDFASIVELCDEVLASEPGNEDAIKAKCAALISENRLPEAITLAKDRDGLTFEYAYALYRSGSLETARAVVDRMPEPLPLGALHLKAQLLYKQHDFAASASAYDKILERADGMLPELRANVLAAMTAAGRAADALSRLEGRGDPLESFELGFNTATALLAAGRVSAAAETLKGAEAVARASLADEGLEAAEIEDELAGIHVQKAYAAAASGDAAAASDLLAQILASKPADKAVAAVAANNLVALRGATELFDSAKRLRGALSHKDKLLPAQRAAVLASSASVSALLNKRQDCREAIAELRKEFPASDAAVLASASLLCRDRAFAKARERLEQFAEANPDRSLRVRLALAQLALARGNPKEAEEALGALAALRGLPGYAASLVALRHARGDVEGAIGALDEAVAAAKATVDAAVGDEGATPALPTWSRGFGHEACAPSRDETRTSLAPRAALIELMMAAAAYRLRAGRSAEAAALLEEMTQGKVGALRTDQRLAVTAATVLAYSRIDPEKAEALAACLPAPAGAESQDVEELMERAARVRRDDGVGAAEEPQLSGAAGEEAPADVGGAGAAEEVVPTAPDAGAAAAGTDPAMRTTQEVSEEKLARKREIEAKRRARKRAKRRTQFLAKLVERGTIKEGEEPPVPPPERWLPKKLRANKRGKRKGYVGGAQGAGDVAAADSKRFDAAARAAEKKDKQQQQTEVSGRAMRSAVGSSAAERRRNRRRRR